MNIDGLIFDLDGTLWDASESCVMAWNSSLKKIQVRDFEVTPELVSNFSGKMLDSIFAEHFTFLPENKLQELAITYEHEEAIFMKERGGKLYPTVKSALQKLASDYKLFIVSNCMKGYIENFLEMHRLEILFTGHTCSGDTGKSKSENISMLISTYELKNPVYVGDTAGDEIASRKNGIPFIYASYGFGKLNGTKFHINELAELKELLVEMATSS